MIRTNTYLYLTLLIHFIVLSFSVSAVAKDTAQKNGHVPGQQVSQETNRKNGNRNESDEVVIENKYSDELFNLKLLTDNSQKRDTEIKELSRKLDKTKGEESKEIAEEIDVLKKQRKELNLKIESLATGVDIENYWTKVPAKFNFTEEMQKLMQPLIHSLNSVTQDSREIEELKQEIEKAKQRQEIAVEATNKLDLLLSKVKEESVKTRLETISKIWKDELEYINNDENILSNQLDSKMQEKTSVFSSVAEVFTDFFRSRGINFVLGIIAFLTVFLILRFFYFLVKKIQFKRKKHIATTFERLTELIFHLLNIVASLIAMLFVFNLLNDWLLLGISVLFLLAIGWGLIKALPTMLEQLMMLLNLGSVREGGRVVINGIPWKVQRLQFYTHLVNPELSGGSMQLPVRQLVGLVSRPAADNEEWFPTSEGEWVKMSDTIVGQIIYQSPEMVQVRLFGGNQITYTAANFLALNPVNLSHGYRIQMVFGIDYKYQAECTTEIPKEMTEAFRQDLVKAVGEDNLILVRVDFFLPNNSSLDFEYEVFLKGSAAYLYEEVERTMIYSFADICNENNWEIPFQQITLHQGRNK